MPTCVALSPGAPALTAPANGVNGVALRPTFTWTGSNTQSYQIDIATDAGFGSIILTQSVTGTTFTPATDLTGNTTFFWRVTPTNYCGPGQTSATFSFTTGVPGQCPSGTTSTTLLQDDVTGWTTDGTGGSAWARTTALSGTGLTGTAWGIPNNTVTSDRGLISPAELRHFSHELTLH